MRNIRTFVVVAGLAVVTAGAVHAGKGHGMADDNMQQSHNAPAQADQAMPMGGTHGGGHAHESWVTPPNSYADNIKYSNWDDRDAARRGQPIFEQQCVVCHGANGRGSGPAAPSLEHKPADLTKHFHTPGKQGDDYLFWRITEGGQAAPFAGSGSMMPAFGSTLTKQERWDVLTYLHQTFHVTTDADTTDEDHEEHSDVQGKDPSNHG